ncbi:MAG: hypothetical protein JJ868_08955 [Shimia sp.]|uniref:hypothetical protein n=1 Tax=Shimia sp. TaxID=1954381 RepID=UPI0019F54E67|nr:hypothetical protein [Shimia sp.]MBE1291210.1 hypothetical protein [Paracoccaceae bacterium]MBO6897485.1 hypothetical protein [Shimia sp.]
MSLASASDIPTPKTKTKLDPATWVWAGIALLVALWGTSIAMFGIPGLYMPAVALVPVIYLALVLISRG